MGDLKLGTDRRTNEIPGRHVINPHENDDLQRWFNVSCTTAPLPLKDKIHWRSKADYKSEIAAFETIVTNR